MKRFLHALRALFDARGDVCAHEPCILFRIEMRDATREIVRRILAESKRETANLCINHAAADCPHAPRRVN